VIFNMANPEGLSTMVARTEEAQNEWDRLKAAWAPSAIPPKYRHPRPPLMKPQRASDLFEWERNR
jgi:hypothetical protein